MRARLPLTVAAEGNGIRLQIAMFRRGVLGPGLSSRRETKSTKTSPGDLAYRNARRYWPNVLAYSRHF